MFLTRIRSGVRSNRGSLLAVFAVALIGLALLASHSVPSAHDMESDESGMSGAAVTSCLAIIQAAATLMAGRLVLKNKNVLRAPRTVGKIAEARFMRCFANPDYRCREGPAELQVFRH